MTECTHDDDRPGAIREGACPRCLLPMERHEDHGRCPCCHGCYSAGPDTISIVLHASIPPKRDGRFQFGRGDLTVTSEG